MLTVDKLAIPLRYQGGAGLASGFFGGLLGGIAALPGPIVFVYLIGKGLRGKSFTKEASLFLVISATLLAVILGSTRSVHLGDWGVSIAALLPVATGMYFGQHLRDHISGDAFKRLVLITVVISGFGLAKKGWDQLPGSTNRFAANRSAAVPAAFLPGRTRPSL